MIKSLKQQVWVETAVNVRDGVWSKIEERVKSQVWAQPWPNTSLALPDVTDAVEYQVRLQQTRDMVRAI